MISAELKSGVDFSVTILLFWQTSKLLCSFVIWGYLREPRGKSASFYTASLETNTPVTCCNLMKLPRKCFSCVIRSSFSSLNKGMHVCLDMNFLSPCLYRLLSFAPSVWPWRVQSRQSAPAFTGTHLVFGRYWAAKSVLGNRHTGETFSSTVPVFYPQTQVMNLLYLDIIFGFPELLLQWKISLWGC